MTNPLTIQLPPNLEQQMLHEAQTQNTTLEHLVLGLIQKHYEVNPAPVYGAAGNIEGNQGNTPEQNFDDNSEE